MQQAKVLFVTTPHKVLCGIYINRSLKIRLESEKKTLDALIELWEEVKKDFIVEAIFYARGPGNLSALKLIHIFVHTLKILNSLEIFALEHFYFNRSSPIKAFGNQYFCQQDNKISLKKLEYENIGEFFLPQILHVRDFHQECTPLYIVPPI